MCMLIVVQLFFSSLFSRSLFLRSIIAFCCKFGPFICASFRNIFQNPNNGLLNHIRNIIQRIRITWTGNIYDLDFVKCVCLFYHFFLLLLFGFGWSERYSFPLILLNLLVFCENMRSFFDLFTYIESDPNRSVPFRFVRM